MTWLNTFTGFLKDMEEYIKNHHRTGLSFTGQAEAKAGMGSAGGAAAAAAPAGGKAPPPMPKGDTRRAIKRSMRLGCDSHQRTHTCAGPLVDKATLEAAAKKDAAASASAGDGDVRNGLFSELNRGGDVTKGLKKVTKDMQTHKNAALRAGGVVKAAEVKENSKHRGIPSG